MVYLTEHCGFSDFEHNRDKVWSDVFLFFHCFFMRLFCLGGGDGWLEVMGGGRWWDLNCILYTCLVCNDMRNQ